MDLTPIATAAATPSVDAPPTMSNDYKSFLSLLVAQVSHQDPLKPIDGTEFVSQLATLTGVEQSVKLNDQMQSLRTQLALSAALSESSLIGRTVTVPSEEIELGPDGADFSYELQGTATSVTAIIRDAAGVPVREIAGLPATDRGLVNVAWDGADANGIQLPPGRYQVALATEDGTGGYNTYSSFEVVSLSFENGEQRLDLSGGGSAMSSQIVRIE